MSQNTATSSSFRPSWLNTAREYLGTKEDSRAGIHNPQIIDFLRSTDVKTKIRVNGATIPVPFGQRYLTDEMPWCAAFINFCLKESGMSNLPSNSASVESWKNYGTSVLKKDIQPGDIVFFKGAEHLGFATSAPKDGKISVISGNKADSIREKTYSLSAIEMARRPKTTTQPQLLSDAAPPLTLAATATTGSDTTPNKNSNNKSHGSQIPPSVLDNLTGVPASTPVSSPSLTTRNVLQLASALSSFQPDRLSDRSSSLSSPQPSENNSSVFNLASS